MNSLIKWFYIYINLCEKIRNVSFYQRFSCSVCGNDLMHSVSSITMTKVYKGCSDDSHSVYSELRVQGVFQNSFDDVTVHCIYHCMRMSQKGRWEQETCLKGRSCLITQNKSSFIWISKVKELAATCTDVYAVMKLLV